MAWNNVVQTVAKWYQTNVHDYNQGKYTQCGISNCGMVRHDCSGYVSACLRAAGIIKTTQIFRSGDFVGSGSAATALRKAGFIQLPYSKTNVRPFDIIALNGHVEIFAGMVGGKMKSYSWGNVHDTAHGGMPCATWPADRFVTIWRCGENAANMSATYNPAMDGATSGGYSSPWQQGGSDPTVNNFNTYNSDIDGAVFADAMNNTFTPSTSLIARGDENEVRTRIYSVNERTIQIDELSMPINIPSTATQEAETES